MIKHLGANWHWVGSWVGGWLDGWTDESTSGWKDGGIEGSIDEWVGTCGCGCTMTADDDKHTDGRSMTADIGWQIDRKKGRNTSDQVFLLILVPLVCLYIFCFCLLALYGSSSFCIKEIWWSFYGRLCIKNNVCGFAGRLRNIWYKRIIADQDCVNNFWHQCPIDRGGTGALGPGAKSYGAIFSEIKMSTLQQSRLRIACWVKKQKKRKKTQNYYKHLFLQKHIVYLCNIRSLGCIKDGRGGGRLQQDLSLVNYHLVTALCRMNIYNILTRNTFLKWLNVMLHYINVSSLETNEAKISFLIFCR